MESCTQHYKIEHCRITSVEHPFIVKNVGKAIKTLGGTSGISKLVCPENADREVELHLHPDDPMAGGILSANLSTDNLLIQVQVPRLTGRKRKRGSSEPFRDFTGEKVPLFKRLSQAEDKSHVTVLGPIERTHRFRGMPDFVYSTAKQRFMQGVRSSILPQDFKSAKEFRLNPSKGVNPPTELIPPPQMSHFNMPFNYLYAQNPGVRTFVLESGGVTVQNEQMARKVRTERLEYGAPVPDGPDERLPPLESLGPEIQDIVNQMRELFNKRPIWTRRAILNELRGQEWKNVAKHTYQYVGYTFRSGPWRDTIVKYGIDPRTDREYRKYQTIMFQFDDEVQPTKRRVGGTRGGRRQSGYRKPVDDRGLGNRSHKFDGVHVAFDGKLWQVCDITDPLLSSLLQTTNLREKCHTRIDGWYHNGTWAKARVIARKKIMALKIEGKVLDDFFFRKIIAMPDSISQRVEEDTHFDRNTSTSEELDMASNVRSLARTNGRSSRRNDDDDSEDMHDSDDELNDEIGDEDSGDDEDEDDSDDGDDGDDGDGGDFENNKDNVHDE